MLRPTPLMLLMAFAVFGCSSDNGTDSNSGDNNIENGVELGTAK